MNQALKLEIYWKKSYYEKSTWFLYSSRSVNREFITAQPISNIDFCVRGWVALDAPLSRSNKQLTCWKFLVAFTYKNAQVPKECTVSYCTTIYIASACWATAFRSFRLEISTRYAVMGPMRSLTYLKSLGSNSEDLVYNQAWPKIKCLNCHTGWMFLDL